MLRGAIESLLNVFLNPSTFFDESNTSWSTPLWYNAFYAAVIAALSSAFTLIYYDVVATTGWLGFLISIADIAIQPVIVALSILLWTALVYATLRFFDYDSFSSTLNVVSYSWLASYPYAFLSTILYFVQVLAVNPANNPYGSANIIVYVASIVLSVASITHITVASVLGLKQRLGASWKQGVTATVIVPLVLVAILFILLYATTV